MRELKFRAWDDINKEIVTQESWVSAGKILERFDDVMQYTGLKDKNGKEIYEGDFLKYENQEYPDASGIYLVSWCEEELAFVCEREEPYNYLSPRVWKECEIVGSICENPELLQ